MEVKYINGKYYINNKIITSANTAMDKNGNKHWKLFLEDGSYVYAYGDETAILPPQFRAKHCRNMAALYKSKMEGLQ